MALYKFSYRTIDYTLLILPAERQSCGQDYHSYDAPQIMTIPINHRTPWLIGGVMLLLLLLVHHSGIISLLLFVRLFYLPPFPRVSLALSLTVFLVGLLKCTKALLFGLHLEKR